MAPTSDKTKADRRASVEAQSRSHAPGPIDAVLDYLAFTGKPQPLSVLLDEAPKRLAACADAEVVSLYLLEGDGRELVMRGTSGFPPGAPGRVRLALGEGITGQAVATQRPIVTADVTGHDSFLPSPEIPEDRYPALAAIPLLGPQGPLGAVVVRRKADRSFNEAEVCLIAALTAPVSTAIRLARLLDELRDDPEGGAVRGARKVTLPGVPVVRGRALGAVAALRRPSTTPTQQPDEGDSQRLTTALHETHQALSDLVERAGELGLGERADFIHSYLLMVDDQQLRLRANESLAKGASLTEALGQVARHATRAAAKGDDDFLIARARDLEQLCDALLMMASPDPRAAPPSKSIVVADQLSIYDVLVTAQTGPVGFVMTGRAPLARSRVLLELLGIPAITGVAGALRWTAPGDIALVDADHGLLTINPARADIAAYRAERRRERVSSRGIAKD
jgi:phosphotransferase system enzyme I (PtsP)